MAVSKQYNLGLAILRIGISAMLLTHGIPKVELLFSNPQAFPDPIGISSTVTLVLTVFAEVICSIFIIIGFKTRLATIPPIILMLVAILVVHINDPIANKELAILYLVGFATIALTGGGKYGINKS